MTKKGFDYEECYLKFDGEIFAIAENKKNAQVIGETLTQLFNENEQLKQENKKLEELLQLITGIFSFEKEESVKELLRNEIKGLNTVSYEFAGAWNDYCILSKFFKERYDEDWDNE